MPMATKDPETKTSPARRTEDTGGTASVVRALQLLELFTGDQPSLGVSDISRRSGIPTSTVHRLLSHLVKGELVSKDGPEYRLSERIFELGNHVAHSRTRGLKDIAAPFLGELFGTTRLTTHLAVLDGPEIIMVDKVMGLRTYPARTVVGGRYPTVCTALGKAMLAFEPEHVLHDVAASGFPHRTRHSITTVSALVLQLADIRATRVAFDRDEATLGQTCVAAPVIQDGRAVAALSVSGGTGTYDLNATGTLLVRATTQLARRLSVG